MTERSNELKPCPFCGADAGLFGYIGEPEEIGCWVECRGCLVSTEVHTKKDAIEAWNRRVSE